MKWKIILLLSVIIAMYTTIGGIVLHMLESGHVSDEYVKIGKAKAIFLGMYFSIRNKGLRTKFNV